MRRLFFALFLFSLVGCTKPASPQPSLGTPPAEFILTSGQTMAATGEVLRKCGIDEVKPLGNGLFLLKSRADPGIEKLRACLAAAGLNAEVQPNFPYRSESAVRF